jgi:hypothetical protein
MAVERGDSGTHTNRGGDVRHQPSNCGSNNLHVRRVDGLHFRRLETSQQSPYRTRDAGARRTHTADNPPPEYPYMPTIGSGFMPEMLAKFFTARMLSKVAYAAWRPDPNQVLSMPMM